MHWTHLGTWKQEAAGQSNRRTKWWAGAQRLKQWWECYSLHRKDPAESRNGLSKERFSLAEKTEIHIYVLKSWVSLHHKFFYRGSICRAVILSHKCCSCATLLIHWIYFSELLGYKITLKCSSFPNQILSMKLHNAIFNSLSWTPGQICSDPKSRGGCNLQLSKCSLGCESPYHQQ